MLKYNGAKAQSFITYHIKQNQHIFKETDSIEAIALIDRSTEAGIQIRQTISED